MSAASQFAYLDTRVAVMAGRLLGDDAVEALIGAPGDQRAAVLRRAGLTLPEGTGAAAGPQSLEQAVVGTLVREAQVLVRPLAGAARDMLTYWMRRLEMANLKVAVRGLAAGLSPDAMHGQMLDLGGMAALPMDAVVHADDVAELLRRLEDTAYADMARHARGIYEEQRDVFGVEAALDREYFRGLAERANALPDASGRDLRRLVGVLIDQVNVVWLLRYRHVFGLEPAHAYYLLVPAGRHLDGRRLLDLVKLGAPEDVLEALPPALRRWVKDVRGIDEAEGALRGATARVARAVLGFTAFNAARPCAYLLLREWQLWQLYGVMEGARLGLSQDAVRAAARLPPAATERR